MKKAHLENMIRGWFIGDFDPSLLKTEEVEVAVQSYKQGNKEKEHFHKIATEYTVILDGHVLMQGKEFKKGDIVIIEPLEVTGFEALEDSRTLVVKIPGAKNDKYLVD